MLFRNFEWVERGSIETVSKSDRVSLVFRRVFPKILYSGLASVCSLFTLHCSNLVAQRLVGIDKLLRPFRNFILLWFIHLWFWCRWFWSLRFCRLTVLQSVFLLVIRYSSLLSFCRSAVSITVENLLKSHPFYCDCHFFCGCGSLRQIVCNPA